MKGMKLPRNLKIKKNEDGTFNIFMLKTKLTMPLKCLEKCKSLTPSQFNYVKDYESRLAKDKEGKTLPCKALDRVKALLDKPKLSEEPIKPMDTKSETIYTEAHYRRLGYKGYADFKIADDKRKLEVIQKQMEAEQERLQKEQENAKAKK